MKTSVLGRNISNICYNVINSGFERGFLSVSEQKLVTMWSPRTEGSG